MCLGTAAEVKKRFNQGLKCENSLDWFGQRWESRFISKRVVSVIVDMVEGVLARWGGCARLERLYGSDILLSICNWQSIWWLGILEKTGR
jgi:hypothetical protein